MNRDEKLYSKLRDAQEVIKRFNWYKSNKIDTVAMFFNQDEISRLIDMISDYAGYLKNDLLPEIDPQEEYIEYPEGDNND